MNYSIKYSILNNFPGVLPIIAEEDVQFYPFEISSTIELNGIGKNIGIRPIFSVFLDWFKNWITLRPEPWSMPPWALNMDFKEKAPTYRIMPVCLFALNNIASGAGRGLNFNEDQRFASLINILSPIASY